MLDAIINILGIFLAALLGIPAGLAVNQHREHRANKVKREQLLSALKGTVEKNHYLVAEIEKWVGKPGGTPFFNADLSLLESTAALKYDLLDDIELCRQVDNLRFELTHFSRKVNLLLELEFSPTARFSTDSPAGSMYNMLRPRLVGAISEHIPTLNDRIGGLLKRLN